MRQEARDHRTELGRRRRRSGHAIVEFTLALPLLVSLLLGVWQFGYAFYNYALLEQAVRDGARYASTAHYGSAGATPTPDFQTAVQNVVVYGNPLPPVSPAPVPVAAGLTTSNVVLTVTFSSGVPTAMTVAINNYTVPATFINITLNNKPSAWFAYTGTFGPP